MSTIINDVDRMNFDSFDNQVSQFNLHEDTLLTLLQTSYVFTPAGCPNTGPLRPKKRRKITKKQEVVEDIIDRGIGTAMRNFPPLLNGLENSSCINARYNLFEESWGYTEAEIKVIRDVM